MPLIDILSDLDLAAIETNSAELLDAVLVHIGLRPGAVWRALPNPGAHANADDHYPA